MVALNTKVAIRDGLLVAVPVKEYGMPFYTIFLLDSTHGAIKEICSRMSEGDILTALDQLIKIDSKKS